jgi:hypothetical protein
MRDDPVRVRFDGDVLTDETRLALSGVGPLFVTC